MPLELLHFKIYGRLNEHCCLETNSTQLTLCLDARLKSVYQIINTREKYVTFKRLSSGISYAMLRYALR